MDSIDARLENTPEVALIFPPLVEGNFGGYYPSIAVLSAYLGHHGIANKQFDLNEELAAYVIQQCRSGEYSAIPLDGEDAATSSISAAIAIRLIGREGARLFDRAGRHLFHDTATDLGHVLATLAKHLRIDVPVEEMLRPAFFQTARAMYYREFFSKSSISTIGESVRTIGISVPMGPQLGPALVLSQFIKRERPDVRIVLGGPVFSLMAIPDIERVLSLAFVDLVIRFDGEIPLAQVARQRRAGVWCPANVPGSSFRTGEVICHVPPAPGPRLDDLPYANYDPALVARLGGLQIGLQQARGCYWGECTYCDFVELYNGSKPFRTRTPARVVDEMEFQMQQHGCNRFLLITESIPPSFARKLSREIAERKVDVEWSSFCMVDRRFTRELLGSMSRSGCAQLQIGVESMTDRVLELVKKSARREDNMQFIKDASEVGISLAVNAIPDLPSTTKAEAFRSLADFASVAKYINAFYVIPFEATASSAIGRDPERFGLTTIERGINRGQSQYANNHLGVVDRAMTDTEREEVVDRFRRLQDRINGRRATSHVVSDSACYRGALEYVDVLDDGERLHFYHWVQRRRFSRPRVWSVILQLVKEISPFTAEEFSSRCEPESLGP